MVLKSRRFKEVTAMVLCVASAMRGWYDLERGAPFGPEIATMALVWAVAYVWLSGRRLPLSGLRSTQPAAREDGAVQTPRTPRPSRRDTPLEAVLSWGVWALFLALVLWIALGA
jgi:hypothetical protein